MFEVNQFKVLLNLAVSGSSSMKKDFSLPSVGEHFVIFSYMTLVVAAFPVLLILLHKTTLAIMICAYCTTSANISHMLMIRWRELKQNYLVYKHMYKVDSLCKRK